MGTRVFVNNCHGLLRGTGQSNNVKMWIRYNNNEKADNWQFTADPGSVTKTWAISQFPKRGWDGNFVIPLYESYNQR